MVNIVAIVVAAVIAFVIGALWYGPIFGKPWRRLMNVPEGAMSGGMGGMWQSMLGGFVATLVMVAVLDYLFALSYIRTMPTALTLAFFFWLGFVATVMSNTVWYEKRPWALYAINVAHYLVVLLVAAAVLVWWPW